jgi:hypothetical protein
VLGIGWRPLIVLSLHLAGPAAAIDEEGRFLVAFWEKQAAASNDCEAVITLCKSIAANAPANPLLPVVRGVQAWHELSAGRTNEATATLQSMLVAGDAPVAVAANTMARRWLTRLDREKVRLALSAYYAEHVGFPASLDALKPFPPDRRPPMTDRWNRPWQYRLASFARLQGLSDQRYELLSTELGSDSDLKTALAAPRDDRGLPLRPVRVINRQEGQSAVEFRSAGTPPRKTIVAEGSRVDNLHFVKLMDLSALLSDGDRWWFVELP